MYNLIISNLISKQPRHSIFYEYAYQYSSLTFSTWETMNIKLCHFYAGMMDTLVNLDNIKKKIDLRYTKYKYTNVHDAQN